MDFDFDQEMKKFKKKMKEVGRDFEKLMGKGEKAGKKYGKNVKHEFSKLGADVSRQFDKMFREHDIPGKIKHALYHMKMMSDVEDKGDHILVTISLPGIERKDVLLNITNNHIEVRAHRREHMGKHGKSMHKKEVHERYFDRLIPLPAHVEHEKAKAKFKNGLLTIIVPKKKVDRKLSLR